MKPITWPVQAPRSSLFSVRVDGREVEVLAADRSHLAEWHEAAGQSVVEISADFDLTGARALPPRLVREFSVSGKSARLVVDSPARVLIECPGKRLLSLFAEPARKPAPTGREVRVLGPGAHEIGELRLHTGQTLWLEPGAIARGRLRMHGDDITVGGGGVLDATSFDGQRLRPVVAGVCNRLLLDGLTVINPATWQVVMTNCRDSAARNLRLLGDGLGTDGVDVVASQRVHVSDCFIVNGDDCLVVKSFENHAPLLPAGVAPAGDPCPADITFERCTVGNFHGGSALEIGHELQCAHVRNVTFRDIDVLFVHEFGAVFGIHNSDAATVENTLYDDIRVHHCYDRLISLRVLKSRWSRDTQPGRINGVLFRNCHWQTSPYNPGYTHSIIGGHDQHHPVENITIENFLLDGKPITHLDQLDIFTRHTHNLRLL
jgi:hypothetical protein